MGRETALGQQFFGFFDLARIHSFYNFAGSDVKSTMRCFQFVIFRLLIQKHLTFAIDPFAEGAGIVTTDDRVVEFLGGGSIDIVEQALFPFLVGSDSRCDIQAFDLIAGTKIDRPRHFLFLLIFPFKPIE